MKFTLPSLLVLVACAFAVQTRANFIDKIKDKVDDVKDTVTGKDEGKKEDGK